MMAENRRYEYYVMALGRDRFGYFMTPEIQKAIDSLARMGWRLVQADEQNGRWYFEREARDDKEKG